MKKVLVAVLVMLFWCNVGFALSQDSAISQYLSDRKLDSIEGIWGNDLGNVTMFAKSGSGYQSIRIKHRKRSSGSYGGSLQKGSENYYYGDGFSYYGNQEVPCDVTVTVNGNNSTWVCTDNRSGQLRVTLYRLWPTDIVAHNAKFKTKTDVAKEEQVVADMVADAKKTCKVIGFEDGSEKFSDCTLKLYTQKVDELVAKKVEANTRMMQSQTTTTTQSSGSNVTTIYDPVRDNKALMQQGQKMLSGACTLGINC